MATKQSKTTLEVLEPILIVAIFAVILYVGYQTLFQKQLEQFLPGGSLNADTQRQELADRKQYYDGLSRLDTLYQSTQADASKQISNLLPTGQDIPTIFASYEAIANHFGLSIQSVDVVSDKTAAQSQGTGVQSLLVSIKVANASYSSVKEFLDAVEKNIRIADVQSISYDPRSRFIDISIRSYYRTNRASAQ